MTFKEREGDEQRWNGRPGRRACGCRRKPQSLLGSLVLLRGSLAPCARVLGFQQSVEFCIPRPRFLRSQKMFSFCSATLQSLPGFQNSTQKPEGVYKP